MDLDVFMWSPVAQSSLRKVKTLNGHGQMLALEPAFVGLSGEMLHLRT